MVPPLRTPPNMLSEAAHTHPSTRGQWKTHGPRPTCSLATSHPETGRCLLSHSVRPALAGIPQAGGLGDGRLLDVRDPGRAGLASQGLCPWPADGAPLPVSLRGLPSVCCPGVAPLTRMPALWDHQPHGLQHESVGTHFSPEACMCCWPLHWSKLLLDTWAGDHAVWPGALPPLPLPLRAGEAPDCEGPVSWPSVLPLFTPVLCVPFAEGRG